VHGRDHRAESIRFCAAFPDNKVKHPYDILFGDGEFGESFEVVFLDDRPLAGRQGRGGTPEVRQRKLHAATRPRLTTFKTGATSIAR
jgi:hypothetical protein